MFKDHKRRLMTHNYNGKATYLLLLYTVALGGATEIQLLNQIPMQPPKTP